MVGYALTDALPFLMMGLFLILGYSTAFVVLFDDRFVKDEEKNFDSLPRALETLLHASVGSFEGNVCLTDTLRSSPILTDVFA